MRGRKTMLKNKLKDWENCDSITELATYEEFTECAGNEPKHLLLGNGFSMAYDNKIFSYNALSNFIEKNGDESVKKLFHATNTKNFEEIIKYMDLCVSIIPIFSKDKSLLKDIEQTKGNLRNGLIEAVKSMHPEHVFKISPEKSKSCCNFLNFYLEKDGNIFSSNYDLLLYWVLMRNDETCPQKNDGFGYEIENWSPPDPPVFSDKLTWGPNKNEQNIFYIHGALPLFDDGIDIVKEQYDGNNHIMQNIEKRMKNGHYPIFVTSGNGNEKLESIRHNRYLDFCYEQLSSLDGYLVTYGFNFGDNDTHIIEAINKASKRSLDNRLRSVYIGVYSDKGLSHIKEIKDRFQLPVRVYDASSINPWEMQNEPTNQTTP